jgi:signal peptidase II
MTTPLPDPLDPNAPAVPAPAGTSNEPAGRERFARPLELGIVAVVVLADQITKAIVRANLQLGESHTVISGFLDFAHVQNTGAAFGMLNDVDFPYKSAIIVVIAAMALLAIAAYGAQLGFHDRLARIGLAMILGGAFGNLMDRAIAGHVVDFVDVYWGTIHFWAFNLADAAITFGAVFVILDTLGAGRRHASNPV